MGTSETRIGNGAELSTALPTHTDAVQIRQALENVLQSGPFRSSRQCQTLLRYVVEHSLAGESDLLRERVIGTEVFSRNADYEPGEDPIVRTRAAEVRKRLAQYYQSSAEHSVRIGIPPGSYKAVFHWQTSDSSPHADARPRSRKWRWNRTSAGIAAIACIAAVVFFFFVSPSPRSPAPSALDQFWAPVFASPKPVLIYNSTTLVFHSPDLSSSTDHLVPVRNQYLCVGDAYASVVLSSLFTRKGKLFQVRYGSDLTFGDLRYQPSILIGAFGNAWTLKMTNKLRFIFDKHPTILDRFTNRLYTLPDMAPDGTTSEDYAVVSRVFDSDTGELLIAVAGITHYGSRAAGEFLTSPGLMTALAASAPGDWPKKNIQVLLHTRIADGTPGLPSIVTTYFW